MLWVGSVNVVPRRPTMSESPPQHGIEAETEFEAKDYFRAGWKMVSEDPFLLVWRILIDGLRWILVPATFLWVLFVTQTWAEGLLTTGRPIPEIIGMTYSRVTSLPFLGATVGLLIGASIFGFLIDALVTGGIWGTLARGARRENIERFSTFGSRVVPGFPKVVGLRVTSLAARWMLYLTGGALGIGLLNAFVQPGGFAEAGLGVQTLVLASSAFVFFVFVALVRLVFQAASAPLFVDDRGVVESIALGAHLVVRHLAGIYRLVIFAAGLMLVPLFAYWGALLVGNSVGPNSPWSIVTWPLEMTAQIFLLVSFSCISVVFQGALFGYWARLHGISTTLPGLEQGRAGDVGSTGYTRETSLDSLLPESSPTAGYEDIPGLDLSEDDNS